jgi:hypothetical protein
MNATHAPNTIFHHSHVALIAMYAALAVQLAVWSSLAAHVNLGAAFTQAHQGTAANIVVGGAIWLVQFTLAVVAVTIRHRRPSR